AGQPRRRAAVPKPDQMRPAGLPRAWPRDRRGGQGGRGEIGMRRGSEHIILERSVRVERIPDGQPMELPEGQSVMITQALGSAFTLWVDGQLVRLRGEDADAIGEA